MKKYAIIRRFTNNLKPIAKLYAPNKKAAIAQVAYGLSRKVGISYSEETGFGGFTGKGEKTRCFETNVRMCKVLK